VSRDPIGAHQRLLLQSSVGDDMFRTGAKIRGIVQKIESPDNYTGELNPPRSRVRETERLYKITAI